MSNVILKIAEEKDRDIWDNIVRENNGTVFHLWDWLKIMEKHSNYNLIRKNNSKMIPLIGLKGSAPVAILPIFYFRNPNYVFSPPPKTESYYLGPVYAGVDDLKQHKREGNLLAFHEAVDKYLKTLKPYGTRFKMAPSLLDVRQLKWMGYDVEPMYDYFIDLKQGEERIYSNFQAGIRKNIKKADKIGIIVEENGMEGLEYVYNSVKERFKEQKEPIMFTREYLMDVFKKFHPEHLKVFSARMDGKIVGGFIILCFNKEVSAWIGSTKSHINGIYPNELLQWNIMKWAIKNEYKKYRISWANNARLNEHKSRYNPDLELYFSASKFSGWFSFFHWIKNNFKKEERK